jgi:hypothetical protein
MKIGRISAISFFLLKTVYFSPVSNPSFWILLLLGGAFFIGGDLGKHEVVLLLLLIGISHRFMPAVNATRPQRDSSSPISLSHYAQLLPIDKRTFFFAFLFSSVIYVVLLTSFCIYIGTICEAPPVVTTMICPPQTFMENAPSGEPLVTVKGLMMVLTVRSATGPFQFKVPVQYSLLFSMLASDIIIDYKKVPDSVFQKFCPIPRTVPSPTEVFSLKANSVPLSKNYSTLLNNLNSIHFGRLLLISCFICLVFVVDATRRFWGETVKGRFNSIFKWIDYNCFAMYIVLCLLLSLDVLLPELIIKRISLIMNLYRIPISIFFFSTFIAGLMRILYVTLPQTDK